MFREEIFGKWMLHMFLVLYQTDLFLLSLFYNRPLELPFFWGGGGALHGIAHEILVAQPGIKPAHPALEAWSLNHWTIREVS